MAGQFDLMPASTVLVAPVPSGSYMYTGRPASVTRTCVPTFAFCVAFNSAMAREGPAATDDEVGVLEDDELDELADEVLAALDADDDVLDAVGESLLQAPNTNTSP